MRVSSAARRYGRAILGAAMEAGKVDEVLAELQGFVEALEASPVVRLRLQDPILGRRRKLALVSAALDAWKPSDLTRRLLLALAENDRAHLAGEVLESFRRELDRRRGIVEVEVTTAAPLDAPARDRLSAALSVRLDRKVRMVEKTDPSILGGVVARVGGLVYDASVLARLEQVRDAMVES